jgi:putative metal-binding protein
LKLLACVVLGLLVIAPAAQAGRFSVEGSTLFYRADPGTVDQISGFDTGTVYRFTRFGQASIDRDAGCTLSPDGRSVDCTRTGVVRIVLSLGDQDDVAVVSANVKVSVTFDGGDGNDGLFGGGGTDEFFGGAGNDDVVSRDGKGETVNCGVGQDTAISDDADTRTSCEEIEGDADSDGVRRPADCDDTNPGIRPGATDVPDDRIDQDCSGADATNLDIDGDGTPRPNDCDDSNPAIRPGAREIVGNAVDENCDTQALAFLGLGGVLRNAWAPSGRGTLNNVLTARDFPRGTRIELRCRGGGCAFRRVVRRVTGNRPVRLSRHFKGRALRRGARVEVRLTRTARIGRVLRFKIGAPGTPSVEFLCLPPGGRVRDC